MTLSPTLAAQCCTVLLIYVLAMGTLLAFKETAYILNF